MKGEPRIVFEDEDLLLVDKPPGLVVNNSDTTSGVETLQDWSAVKLGIEKAGLPAAAGAGVKDAVAEYDPDMEFMVRGGVVHRLDKDTSGLLLVAKKPTAFAGLKSQFQSRQVKKRYLALVHGIPGAQKGVIEAPIGRNPANRRRFGIFPGGREARTEYQILERYRRGDERFALLSVSPQTGRTHQIRVHLKYLGYPIVGDPLYAGRRNLRRDGEFCPRLFLHAANLEFSHPVSGKELSFESPLPPDLLTALSRLDKIPAVD